MQKLSKGLPISNAFSVCLILYQKLTFFSFLERGILKTTFGVKQKQKRWNTGETLWSKIANDGKITKLESRGLKSQVCILGRKKSKVTLTQRPWEKREEARAKRRNL